MANRTWTGGAGTWDATTGTHWVGGVAPVAGDGAIFDGTSGGGVVTADSSISGISFLSLTAGSFTGTLDFSVNNPNMNFTSFVSFSGSGARTINLGSGTWTITGSAGSIWGCATVTGLTPIFANSTIVFAGASNQRTFDAGGAGVSYGAFVVANNATKGNVAFSSAASFTSITVGSGTNLVPIANGTLTISGALNITGTQTAPSGLTGSAPGGTTLATVSVGAASTLDWCGINGITKAGVGTLNATNSLDMGRNTNFTSISPPAPSGGGPTGGGGQRVISG